MQIDLQFSDIDGANGGVTALSQLRAFAADLIGQPSPAKPEETDKPEETEVGDGFTVGDINAV